MKSVYPEETWEAIKTDPYRNKIFTHLVKGNLYAFMNKFLDFKINPEGTHPWIPKRPR